MRRVRRQGPRRGGLVPGLRADDPQDSYFHYTAPSGTTYDLLLISDLPPYHTLYDYLMDSRLGSDVGDQPAGARPGDVVVTYAAPAAPGATPAWW